VHHETAVEYDGIIIGAGHHGLVLGAYLARAGLNVLLLERRLMYGGGLATVEATLLANVEIETIPNVKNQWKELNKQK
jgi:phytoene dehydrogenase-like protein